MGRPEYRIGPGDLLKVQVFQIPDLDRDVRVDNAGRISLPLIGSVEAAGLSVAQLQDQVAARYRERYLQDPQVTVSLQESPNQRVTVGGAVTEPGVYPMGAPHLTLQQAVAMGRGITNVANPRNVIVFRTVGGERMFARFDLKQIQQGELRRSRHLRRRHRDRRPLRRAHGAAHAGRTDAVRRGVAGLPMRPTPATMRAAQREMLRRAAESHLAEYMARDPAPLVAGAAHRRGGGGGGAGSRA